MRFFILNPGKSFVFADVREKTQMSSADVRRDINAFLKVGLIKVQLRNDKKAYMLDETFSYYVELRDLFIKSNVYPHCTEIKNLKRAGRIKLVMISGVFLNYAKSEIDLLLVGDDIDREVLNEVMSAIEAEIGREVRYMALSMEDFHYRLEMMDRFLIDFFSGPQDTIINKIPGLSRFISEIKN